MKAKLIFILGFAILVSICIIRLGRAGDVSVYNIDNFEIMHGYTEDEEIRMEDEGHIVSGTISSDGHIFMYNYKTGRYIEGSVDEIGRGRVYDYATGKYYDINID